MVRYWEGSMPTIVFFVLEWHVHLWLAIWFLTFYDKMVMGQTGLCLERTNGIWNHVFKCRVMASVLSDQKLKRRERGPPKRLKRFQRIPLANMVANDVKIVAKVTNSVSKNDANLALPPRFRQVLLESPL
ncbi:hypothetical protein TNCV_136971 [Trichonephila clavipes]|nr:hypothetical protein TNCV_136971 [Trichonephila clavipes]